MRIKVKAFRKTRNGIWKNRGKWEPVYVQEQQNAQGIEFQHAAWDANNRLVYAGVTRHAAMNQASANQIHRVWLRWRREYDTIFDGVGRDYPAKHIPSPVNRVVMYPIDNPAKAQTFLVREQMAY